MNCYPHDITEFGTLVERMLLYSVYRAAVDLGIGSSDDSRNARQISHLVRHSAEGVLHARRRAGRLRTDLGSRANTRSRAASTRRCIAGGCGRCASTPVTPAPKNRTRATASCWSRGRAGLSVAFDLPTQIGYDADDPMALGEVGKVGVSISSLRDMERLFEGIPLDKVSTSMTINAPAAVLLAMYIAVGKRQGVEPSQAARHGAERHPQGVHRARDVHLPAQAVDAADHRPVRLLQNRLSRTGTRSASAATTSARRAAPPCRRSPSRSPTASPTCRRRSTPGWMWTTSRRSCRSSSTRTTSSSKKSPSSARRASCGR